VISTTPAIVTQAAVRQLPRALLLLFCLAYALPGYVGREPWKTADAAAFGVMYDLASGGDWWNPGVLGAPADTPGWLAYWLGAWAIRLQPFLAPDVAVRLPFIALLLLTFACTWYSVYHLARVPAALPVSFAFGGEASPRDYARALADAAVLALMACLGLAQLSHETTPDVTRLAGTAAMLYGVGRLVGPAAAARGAQLRAALAWTAGCVLLVFAGAPGVALILGAGVLAIPHLAGRAAPTPPVNEAGTDGAAAPALGALTPRLWLAATLGTTWLAAWWLGVLASPSWPAPPLTLDDWQRWGRLLTWFTWPAWPMAIWTLWRWRRQLASPHLLVPLWFTAVGVWHSFLAGQHLDRALLLALPGFAVLAAFALPTMRRSMSALIDWFTLLFFSICALIIWVIWFAMMTGFPAKPAANVVKLAPGFRPEFSWWLCLVGLAATLAWIALVAWRARRHQQALWKSLVLPAAGTTLCWSLLMSLWLPLLDHALSYGPLSRRIAALVPLGGCVVVDGLDLAQESALRYHGGLQIVRLGAREGERCRALIVESERQDTLWQRTDLTQWAYRATVRRLTDRKERFALYIRVRH
jgi:4-amino-4-deoxy-L-arabinose transferase-like glycosyltransferase